MNLATHLVWTQFVLSVYKEWWFTYNDVYHHILQTTTIAVTHQFISGHFTIILMHWLEYPDNSTVFHYGKENYLISNMKIGFEPVMAVRFLAVSAAAVYCIDIGIDCPIIAMVLISVSETVMCCQYMIWNLGVYYWQFSTSAPVWTFRIVYSRLS